MSPSDRMKHIYVVGKTGSGKTNLMKRIARQDIAQGKGCVVISPHADLINFLVDSAGDRADDIILLDFGDKNYVPQMNPLAVDVSSDAEYARAAEQLTDLVSGLSYHEFTGPVFHDAVRTALQTAALPEIRGDRDPNIAVAVEIVRDSALRGWAAKIARNSRRDLELDLSRVADLRASERSEYERWVTAKFDSFAVNGPLRSVTSTAGGCPLSFKEIYRNQKVLLVHLPDTYLGGNSAELIGRFIFERLYQEARQTQATSRKDFYIHVDEFQRFVNRDLEILVTEARKFKMGLTFAHQNLRQLHAFSRFEGTASPRLAEAIFSNVGTLIAMRTSGSDVGTIAAELEVREQHVRRIGQYEALARPSLAGAEQRTCTLRVPLESVPANRKVRAELRKRMIREGYWASRTTVERGLESHFAALRESVDGSPQRRKLPASSSKSGNQKSFLDEWLEKRKSKSAGSGDQTTDDSKGISA
ncbi:type IV secretory system conjugative DNA transfer family protein [Rhodococcus sp. A5(2022)]|uniref:type IV secretory system conjugative DNA transfer family protein n=1 Tax=Rhodococcus sp. A5(2022) TaxID=3003588 RepID=UPI0022A81CA6|nr:type IV secretion system DNA-binding domain-containing protein [Rhodococcus sp. A5(2022)]MCZ1075262.1 type IV secretion system DNA-binding domain-containing protein [Rhodococcus sp. A5(2022)]